MNPINKLKDLWKSESPVVAKWITNIGVLLATVSMAILGVDEVKKGWIPSIYTEYSKHAFTLSLIISAIFKFTKKKDVTTKE